MRLVAAVIALAASGCLQQDLDEVDGVFYPGGARTVHCAMGIDDDTHNSLASIDGGLDRARDRGEVIELYAHVPGTTISTDVLEHVLAGARARGLPFVTYADLAGGDVTGPGLALSFDDDAVAAWTATRDLFMQYDARVTFFVTRYDLLQPNEVAEIHQLAADGHAIEAHTARHLHGPEVVEDHGLADYVSTEVLPSITNLDADGYTVSAFAYPFGDRTDETDRAVLREVPLLRSIASTWGDATIDFCPLD
jgi:peptidoglycan/xylan/chitin deacetylase (PgdA/CDA1 family)